MWVLSLCLLTAIFFSSSCFDAVVEASYVWKFDFWVPFMIVAKKIKHWGIIGDDIEIDDGGAWWRWRYMEIWSWESPEANKSSGRGGIINTQ